MNKIQIGQGNDNWGTFYIVPNQMNGIICRNLEIAKKIKDILEKFEDIDEGIERFNYLAFHECPEPEELRDMDNYEWAIREMEKEISK